MKIANERTLKDLQEDFQKAFPFLKIEFYKSGHKIGEDNNKEEALDLSLLVGDVRALNNYGLMTIDQDLKTGEFEKLFAQIYGLNVQVFRKSYGEWLQTWATDNWTLKEQNERSAKLGDKTFEKLTK